MRYLGLDLGTKTLGLAISDKTGTIASSLVVLHHDDDFNSLIEDLKKIIKENLKITGTLYVIGVISGFIIDMIL